MGQMFDKTQIESKMVTVVGIESNQDFGEKNMGKRKTEPPSPESIKENIMILPAELRRKARKHLRKSFDGQQRHGSECFARKHPELAVTDEERADMALMIAHGAHYRPVEGIFHLAPCNGNDVYRCVKGLLKRNPIVLKKFVRISKGKVPVPVS